MGWTSAPSVRLDLEFRHQHVTAFFDLILEPRRAGIALKHVACDPAEAEDDGRRLIEAIADARLPARSAADLQ
jgi:hypothetical protein